MIRTLPLDDFDQYAENVYEAILMIARRARQINELQKRIMDKEAEAYGNSENYDDEGVNRETVDRQYLKLPKPTTIALQEMLEGKLNKEYLQED